MKARPKFVSNSSSSSFIVSTTGNTKVAFEFDLAKIGAVASTVDELNNAFLDRFGGYDYSTIEEFLSDNDYYQDRYDECLEAIEKGEKIILGRVSNDSGNDIQTTIYNNGVPKTEGITIIQEVWG